ncbi:MAG: hypothetical protein R3Y29_08975 [bacterium]
MGLKKNKITCRIYYLNCWEVLKLIKLQREDEKSLSVRVVKTEKIN